jgi:hypothetical protein
MSLSQQARQSRHAFPWSGAGQLRPVVTTVDVRGQEPGAGPSTFVALSLIVRLAGTRSCGILERSPASRVGSQCATSGVSLQTWNIFNRCLTLWMSPLSCHLNQRLPGVDVRCHGPRPVGPGNAGKSSHHGVHDIGEPVAPLQCIAAVARSPRYLGQLASSLAMDRGQVIAVPWHLGGLRKPSSD